MVIVVREDKQWSLGQTVKKVAEGVIGGYEQGRQVDEQGVLEWERGAWPKICVRCKDAQEMKGLVEKARKEGITHYVKEEKREGEETMEPSILVVGPAVNEKVNQITGHLKLL